MPTHNRNPESSRSAEVVEAGCESGGALGSDGAMAVDHAARRLERVLVRGHNVRIQAALAALALEFAPWGA
jgi:hypothetical protein